MATLALCVGAAMFAGAVTSLIISNPSGSSSIVAMLWVISGSIWLTCGLLLTALEKRHHHKHLDNDVPDGKDQQPR